ncbi:hypothetical protein TanjilG_27608 [Lupinus angustifolius]|uniref:NB-ARC domain-containing protein n=1 Tax=Lupinus angustifolius TaxID=3871 RepID=A0A1J7GLV9_LUPAN|nr:PREDICTED: disease resistance protein RPM1-like [Lupinus angustifolius]OIV89106.1 hypothetical protein TanjilG_27608 [Lupinus angustifolius]
MMETAVSFVGDKLLPLLLKLVKAINEVPKDVAEITKELQNIQDFINEEDRRAGTEEHKTRDRRKEKVKQLKEQTFRIEDVTEDYMINEEQHSHNDPGCASLPCDTLEFIKAMILRLQISYEIQDIKLRLHEIDPIQTNPSSLNYIGIRSENAKLHNLRRNALYIEEDNVVGFEAPRDELIGWLEEARVEPTVISVVGMGGQGKTTLAKIVFDKVIGKFDCYAWITVSQVYDVEVLLKNVMNKLWEGTMEEPKDISKMDKDMLFKEVRKYLEQKRYVILFDDVWDKNFWNEIKFALVANKKRSRILITTRSNEVAKSCKVSFITHSKNLLHLPQKESWDLFCKKAFLNELHGLCPKGLENISSKIVEKCNGLPLAIIAAGDLLACKDKNSSEWKKLCETLISELEKNPNSTGITNILGLSYDDCPYYLKPCFLYFGIYPENCEVESATLIKQWVAEGFVRSERDKTLEEVAEQYLRELIYRNLVQVSSFSIDGKAKRCRVHDLLHKLILTKIEDLSFCHFVKEEQPMFSGMIRRLKIETNSKNFMVNIEGSHTRSLYIFGGKELSEDSVKIIPTQFKLLKVLEFVHSPLAHVPENLGNLIRLRYLSFRKTNVESLPNSIGNLQFLETLDLRQTRVRQMPKEINKLKKLRHLLANHTSWGFGNGIQMMEGVGDLVCLQTLRQVETDYRGEELVKELEKLRQLRLLGLINVKQEYGTSLCSSINEMQHLEKLYIDAIPFDEVIDLCSISPLPLLQKLRLRGKLIRMPKWIPRLENLVRLSLISSKLIRDPLESLADMQNLLYLSLDSAYEGESLVFPDGGFKTLKKLSLRHMDGLDSIKVGEGALPSLKELMLDYIPQLNDVPCGIENLGMLGIFHIVNMPEEFRESIREDQWIKNHVRQVYIIDSVRQN